MKSLSCNVGEGRVDEGALQEMILGFVVEHLIFGTQNFTFTIENLPNVREFLGV